MGASDQAFAAISKGDVKALEKILTQNSNPQSYRNADGNTLLHAAVEEGNEDILYVLLNSPKIRADVNNDEGKSALHYALELGFKDTANAIIQAKANSLNSECKDGRTAMHYAAMAEAEDAHKLIPILAEKNPDAVNATDNQERTPLHFAAEQGNAEAIATLIECGAVVHSPDQDDVTALHLACKSGSYECVKALLETDQADVNHTDKEGSTPNDYTDDEKIVKLLKKYGGKKGNPIIRLLGKFGLTACSAKRKAKKQQPATKGKDVDDDEEGAPEPEPEEGGNKRKMSKRASVADSETASVNSRA